MVIQSSPFQATILTGEDARQFKKHLDEPQNPKAKEVIDCGVDMVRNGDTKFKIDVDSIGGNMSGKKIIDGLDEAITQAAIKRRIYDWIKCDASIAVKRPPLQCWWI